MRYSSAVRRGLAMAASAAVVAIGLVASPAAAVAAPPVPDGPIPGNILSCANVGLPGPVLLKSDGGGSAENALIRGTVNADNTLDIEVLDPTVVVAGVAVDGPDPAVGFYVYRGAPSLSGDQLLGLVAPPPVEQPPYSGINHWWVCGTRTTPTPTPTTTTPTPTPTTTTPTPTPTTTTPTPTPTTTTPTPTPTTTTPTPTPTLGLNILTPVCDNDVPYLTYEVDATGLDDTTVTITWDNPNGPDVVYADQPLTGRVLWPGAVVDAQGDPLDWPGWVLQDGVWVQADDGFAWVRPSVQVVFEVNPTAVVTVGYPPSSPDCDANPPAPTPTSTSALASTGSSGSGPLVGTAAALVTVGAGLVIAARRRGAHRA